MPTLAVPIGLSTTLRSRNHLEHQGLAAMFRDLFKAYPQVAVSSQFLRLIGSSGLCRGRETLARIQSRGGRLRPVRAQTRHNRRMCLLALAWKAHPRWQLVMAGNRDEFHARPTAALAAWPAPDTGVMAGRDLRSGGTWAGIGQNGRMAVVTNVRDPLARQTGPSRGALVADFLRGSAPAAAFADALAPDASAFAPFNLLLADRDSCQFLGNHPLLRRTLSPGLHGMSNGPLDAPWPK
ncbi:NRDE family protein, partial [Stenotrophomonas sp.]|uniref:NRDE family protein n=1 Tax=Stenotrophomonas sp. TaxID=69392 RepID=UPI0028AFA9AC